MRNPVEINKAKEIVRQYKIKHNKYPTRKQIEKLSGYSSIVAAQALIAIKTEHKMIFIREAEDEETINQANALLMRQWSRPFTALEYVSIMRALHPDTSTIDNRIEAFKLINNRKLLLREEGRIELRGRRIPRTQEEWEAAKKAVFEARSEAARKAKVGG